MVNCQENRGIRVQFSQFRIYTTSDICTFFLEAHAECKYKSLIALDFMQLSWHLIVMALRKIRTRVYYLHCNENKSEVITHSHNKLTYFITKKITLL